MEMGATIMSKDKTVKITKICGFGFSSKLYGGWWVKGTTGQSRPFPRPFIEEIQITSDGNKYVYGEEYFETINPDKIITFGWGALMLIRKEIWKWEIVK
jgi:hypothetical protein